MIFIFFSSKNETDKPSYRPKSAKLNIEFPLVVCLVALSAVDSTLCVEIIRGDYLLHNCRPMFSIQQLSLWSTH